MTSAADPGAERTPRTTARGRGAIALGIIVLAVLTLWRVVLPARDGGPHDFTGATMGTTYTVRIDAPLTAGERATLADTIQARLAEVDALMSTWDTASQLSRFNRHGSSEPFPVSPLMIEVMRIALDVGRQSGGAFDVTVAPLVDAWGFGPAGEPQNLPDERMLADLRARTGQDLVRIDSAHQALVKIDARTVLDLSAVAKGYGADRVADALAASGLRSYLVEVGGELRVGGPKLDGTPWRIGVEQPDPGARRVHRTIDLVDAAVATSGDYRNFFERDGRRWAHIIDPRTGRPVPYAGASVTVLHDRAAVADAWATALTVLGPLQGLDVAERANLAVVFITRTDSGFVVSGSTRFGQRFDRAAPDTSQR